MSLREYFENTKGTGVLATADKEGKVDIAVFARPHIMDDGTVGLIMRDRLTYSNLKSNPHAAYMFLEEGEGYKGKRLFLTKIREEENSGLIKSLKRRASSPDNDAKKGSEFLVIFNIDKELPLIGSGE